MTRGFSGALLASLAVASGALSAADLSPQAFAYGLPIVTTGDAAAYRVAIPRTVYLQSQRADLGDLRLDDLADLRQIVLVDGEGEVGGAVDGDVLDDHVDVGARFRERAEEAGGDAGLVRHADDGDLGLVFFQADSA